MKPQIKLLTTALLLAGSSFLASAQTLKVPAPSPAQTIKQAFALGEITIDYSRPAVKGRTVFGDLVPYGKIWRTGANGSTKITFTDDVKVEGYKLPAGTYAIYSVPGKNSWDIMFYKDLTLNGNVADYKQENEVILVKVKPTALINRVESFTINIADVKPSSAVIEIMWDKTRVPLKVTSDIDGRIMKNIETAINVDNKPYFQAASYYYENNKDLTQALMWANKAVEQYPKAFWVMMLKAKIEYKMKDKKSAIMTAQKVVDLATEAKNDDYVAMAKKLISDAKGR